MKYTVYDFLHRGYFPKELPPAFNTYCFALNYEKIWKKWNAMPLAGDSTKGTMYSISKGALCRRNLTLPNPVTFLDLVLYIEDNIDDITDFCNKSTYSQSLPTYDTNIHSRCFRPSSPSVLSLMKKKLKLAQNKQVEIKLDINNFYPSIYTHSITWAMVGKDKAKEIWRANGNRLIAAPANKEEELYNIGYSLDTKIERCQDKQTSGIPIGPDSSFIVAELLTSYVDQRVAQRFPHINACRYYDDYSIFVSSRDEAETVIRFVQQVLSELELTLNESKLEVREAPSHFIDDFSEELAPFRFEGRKTETVLTNYFNLLWKLCELHPNRQSTIIRYGLRPLENNSLQINVLNKELFESLIYKTALVSPSSLDLIYRLLSLKNITPTVKSLQGLIKNIISHHAPLNHHHEIAWSLWFCKKYSLPMDKECALAIFCMRNPVCTLMLLDHLNTNAVTSQLKSDPDISQHIKQINAINSPETLYGEDWILLYEGNRHGWLQNTNIVTGNPHFKTLYDNGISFYDENNDADYQSYDYIETLPYDAYPQDMRKEAKERKRDVFSATFDRLYKDIEDKEYLDERGKEELRKKCKSIVKSHGMEKTIFDSILSQLFRRESIDMEEYVNDIVNEVMDMMIY